MLKLRGKIPVFCGGPNITQLDIQNLYSYTETLSTSMINHH